MTEQPTDTHCYRVNTPAGVRFLNESEKDRLMDSVFSESSDEEAPTPPREST